MSGGLHPLAGEAAPTELLLDVGALLAAYAELRPDPAAPAQRVAFGTSGHRGSSLARSFNEWHVLAITQAICEHRAQHGIDGPLFVGIDTHALSQPALESTLEVLAGNGVPARVAAPGEFTPTPAVSLAILEWNRGRERGLGDGIVITPSHNPPEGGGYKYNPPHGGPAGADITGWIGNRANQLLEDALKGVQRVPFTQAMRASTTQLHDFRGAYVEALGECIDFDPIRGAGLRLAVDPLGGAGVLYWAQISERYGFALEVLNDSVDPQFAFMTLDWDGRIRMDPSSPHAMQRLVALRDRYDVAFACDTDHDRHGIVAGSCGLMPANHYLATAIDYLFRHRPQWPSTAAVGKTLVSSAMIDRVCARLGRECREMPVGFKWFADGLFDGSLGFAGEESAGAAFLRRDGRAWTTDKDGIQLALLAAEMTARDGRDPGERYAALCQASGAAYSSRVDAPASAAQKRTLSTLQASAIDCPQLAGDPVRQVLDRAPGNGAPIGGIKLVTDHGWFAARPSGTEDIYKIYAESLRDEHHLQRILSEAQQLVDVAFAEKSPARQSREAR